MYTHAAADKLLESGPLLPAREHEDPQLVGDCHPQTPPRQTLVNEQDASSSSSLQVYENHPNPKHPAVEANVEIRDPVTASSLG
jgi:hypothetical protein